jgi:L-fuconolactonase
MRRRFAPPDLLPLLKRHGVARCVVMQSAPHEDESRYLMDLTTDLSWVHGVVAWSDLESPDLPRRLQALGAAGRLLGLRVMLHRLDDPNWIARPTVVRGLRTLADAALSLDMVTEPVHLSAVRESLRQVPGLRAIVNHGATPPIHALAWQPWADGIAALASDTRAWCKFSAFPEFALPRTDAGLETLSPYAEHLVRCFGPERLLFASNWPCCDRAGDFGSWWTLFHALLERLHVTAEQRLAMLGDNALRAYQVPPAAATSF